MSEQTTQSQDLRSFLLDDEGSGGKIIEHTNKRGETRQVEVRPPSLAEQRKLRKQAKDKKTGETDEIRLMALSIIACTYAPDTSHPVFRPEDEEAILERRSDPESLIGKIARTLGKILAEKPEEIEADFDEARSDK